MTTVVMTPQQVKHERDRLQKSLLRQLGTTDRHRLQAEADSGRLTIRQVSDVERLESLDLFLSR